MSALCLSQEPPNLKRQSLRFPPVTHQWSGGYVTERNTLPVMEPVDFKPLGTPRFYKHDLLQVRLVFLLSLVVNTCTALFFVLLRCFFSSSLAVFFKPLGTPRSSIMTYCRVRFGST